MTKPSRHSYDDLVQENANLRAQLREAQTALQRIRTSPIDGPVVEKSEEVWHESEVWFRALIERIGDVFWISEPASKTFVYVSPAFASIWGRSPQELYDRFETWIDAIHEDDRARVARDFFANIHAGTYDVEYRIVRPDGSMRWVHDRGKPLGVGTLVAGVAEDITERKHAEEALRQSEARLRLALDAADMGSWDVDLLTGHAIWNRRHATVQGYDEPGPHSIEQWRDRVHPDDLERVMIVAERAMRERTPFAVEHRVRLPESNEIRWLSLYGRFSYGEAGEPVRFSGISLDITERKKSDDRFHESEERFHTLADNISQLAWMADERGRIFWYNQRWFDYTGTTFEEMQGWGWKQVHHPDHLPRVLETWRAALAAEKPWEESFPLRGQNGEYRWFLSRAVPIRNMDGRILRWFGTNTDITDLRKTDQALQERNRQLDLLARMSQELILGEKSEAELLEHVFAEMGRMLNMEMFYHYRPSDDPRVLRLDTFSGITDEEQKQFATMPVGEHLCGRVAAVRQSLIIDDLPNSGQKGTELLAAAGVKSYAGFPLMAGGEFQGTLAFVSRHRTACKPDELQIIQTLCDQVAATLERTRLLDDLQTSEQRLRLAHQAARIGAFEWNLQTDVTTWTPEMEAIYGLAPDTFSKTQQAWETFLVPDDRDEVLRGIAKALATGQQVTREFRIVRHDGSIRWVAGRWQAFLDEQGRPLRLSGVHIDITERKHSEAELRQSEQHLRRLLEALHVFVGVLTPDGMMVECNSAPIQAAGLRREDVIGAHFADSFWWNHSEESSRRIRRDIERAARGEMVRYDTSVRVRSADGAVEFIDVDFALTPVFNEAGAVTHLVPIGIDISERTRAESALRKSETLLRELATHLEHRVEERTVELRQSHARLRALANELNLAEQRERTRLAGELHDYLAQLLVVLRMKLRQSVPHVTGSKADGLLKEADQILTQSLDYTRSLVAQLTPPALHEFGLLQALDWLASQMQQHGLQVLVTHPQEVLAIPEDQAVLIFQSVRELLFNVLKHAKAKQVTICASVMPTHELHVSVIDDGCGFDPETLSKQQADPKRFGLFSLRERLAAMGGRCEIHSTVGQGTRALLVTPYWPAPSGATSDETHTTRDDSSRQPVKADRANDQHLDQSQPPSTQDPLPAAPHSTIRVLLVDDHAMVRQGLRSVLEGYDDVMVVGEASNGTEALDRVHTLRPSMVIMDINMPVMNGIEATAAIKTRHPHIPVIGLSVQAGGVNEESMKQAGAVTLLTKEAAVEELYGAIRKALPDRNSLEARR